MVRVLFVATHPEQCTGYARIGHRIANYLAAQGHELHYFAFQKYAASSITRQIHPSIRMIDVHALTTKDTFGMDIIVETMARVRPDVLLVYNDIIVTCRILNALLEIPKTYRMIAYLDLVYPYESWDLVQHVRRHADRIFVFSEYWRTNLAAMGVPSSQIRVFPHGVDECVAPVPRREARARLGLPPGDFLVLNTNRNSYRKALDITVRAFLTFWKRTGCAPGVKLVLNCRLDVAEGYDILHLARIDALKLGLDYDTVVNAQILRLGGPTGILSDATLNDLYNACDVGLNTCVGEGFGLCNLEHASLGRPQIVSDVGGLGDIFRGAAGRGATLVPAPTILTLARGIDAHSGELCIPDAAGFAAGLWDVYTGETGYCEALRTHIAGAYAWPALLETFHADLLAVEPPPLSSPPPSPPPVRRPPVFWINVDARSDRRVRMLAQLRDLGIADADHTRIAASPDPAGRAWMSCLRAHYEAVRAAYRRGCAIAVIVEDDVVLPPGFFDELAVYVARLPAGWGAFQAHYICPALLRHLTHAPRPRTVARGYMMSCACYAYSRAGMAAFLEKMGRDRLVVPIDPATARAEELVFRYVDAYMALHPLAFTDESLGSSIQTSGLNGRSAEALAGLATPPPDAWAPGGILELPYDCHWVADEPAAAALFVGKNPSVTVLVPGYGGPKHVAHKASIVAANAAGVRASGAWSRVATRVLCYDDSPAPAGCDDGTEVLRCGPGILGALLQKHAAPESFDTDYVLMVLDDVELPVVVDWARWRGAGLDIVSPAFGSRDEVAHANLVAGTSSVIRREATCEFFCYLMPRAAYARWWSFLSDANPWLWGMDLILERTMGLRVGVDDATVARHWYKGEGYASHPAADPRAACRAYLASHGVPWDDG